MTRQEAAALARAKRAEKAPTLDERFWSKVDRQGPDECWPWKAAARRVQEGYGAFWLNGRHQPAQRVALMLSKGIDQIEDGLEACHRCDNPSCCNPDHLFLGSRQDNNADKVAKGRHAHGSRIGTAKLSEEQARQIKDLKPLGRAPIGLRANLARRFGVSIATITDVWSRRWTHLN